MSALSYTECEIDRGAVASTRETFAELHSLIIGRSGGYNTITTHVGFEFSDMIGENLRRAANNNQFAWSSSMMACTHAYGVLDKISTDVQWYENKIEEIKGDLSTALANSAEPDNLTIAQQIIESYNLKADKAWRDLETRCDESQEMLKEGPTPENIRALADGGHFGTNENIGFYTTGDFDYFHVDEGQAELIATHLGHAVLDGNEVSLELLEDNPEYLALISAVVARGLTAQQSGEKLLDGEVEFLETLFGDLEEIGGGDQGFLGFVDQVNSSEHISDSLREDINRHLANSILVLSDEGIGGGVGRLPQDVRDVLDVPEFPDVNELNHDSELDGFREAHRDWGRPFTTLSTFLDSSGPGVQGGTEFSTALMGTVAATLEIPYFSPGEPGDEHFQNIIEVASRNDEANHIVLTGEDFEGNPYEHYESHGDLSPENFLETFYTHNWEDDGAAVSGITDWITEYQQSGDEAKSDIGDRVFLDFVDLVTSEDMQNKLSRTGHSMEDPVLKDDKGDPIVWEDISFGHLNPEIGYSFADIFLANLDAMGSDYGIDSNALDSGGEGGASSFDPVGNPQISMDRREVFAEYIVGSEEVATFLKTELFFAATEEMGPYMGEGERSEDIQIPQRAGILNGILDNALIDAGAARTDNTNASIDYRNKVTGNVVDILFSGVPTPDGLPIADMGVEALKVTIKESLADSHAPNPKEDHSGKYLLQLKNNAMIQAAASMTPEEFREFGFSLPSESAVLDSDGRLIANWEDWVYSEEVESAAGEPLSPVTRNDVNDSIKSGFRNNSESPVSARTETYGLDYDEYYNMVTNP